MSILINENLLRSKYLQETGNERPTHEFSKDYSTYVEWLEEKLSMLFQEKAHNKVAQSNNTNIKSGGIEIMEYGVIKCIVSSNELLPTDEEIKKRAIATVKCKYPFPDDEAYHDFQEFINGFEQGAKWVRNLRREETK